VGNPGAAGTIYLLEFGAPAGALIIDNNSIASIRHTPLLTQEDNLLDVFVRNRGTLGVTKTVDVLREFRVTANGTLKAD